MMTIDKPINSAIEIIGFNPITKIITTEVVGKTVALIKKAIRAPELSKSAIQGTASIFSSLIEKKCRRKYE